MVAATLSELSVEGAGISLLPRTKLDEAGTRIFLARMVRFNSLIPARLPE
jgi:hypothetical protein